MFSKKKLKVFIFAATFKKQIDKNLKMHLYNI